MANTPPPRDEIVVRPGAPRGCHPRAPGGGPVLRPGDGDSV